MLSSFRRGALAGLIGLGVFPGAGAQTQTGAPPPTTSPTPSQAASTQVPSAASAPGAKKKHASRAKTPPGKPPQGFGQCNQGDKAQQQRCLNDMYGPGGPRI